MDNGQLPKGQSVEINGDGRPSNLPGVYRHEAAEKEVITSADPADGAIQADALVRVGYVRVGDVPQSQDIKAMREAQLEKDKAAGLVPPDPVTPTNPVPNGTTSRSPSEVEAELAATKATLAALQNGLKSQKDKDETQTEEK